MKLLNLGCGHKVSDHPNVVNIDWSIYLRVRRNRALSALASLVLRGDRLDRFRCLPANIVAHDLSRGIPFPDDSVDAVFHSNMLEHLDREVASTFLGEVLRVLKPSGIHRIVVPDFELACSTYLRHVAKCSADEDACSSHDDFIGLVIEQSVRREAAGTQMQRPFRRLVENALLGDARRRGETHQWMYDRISLAHKLRGLGYTNIRHMTFDTSDIAGWSAYGLDINPDGSEYATGSLYMEASK